MSVNRDVESLPALPELLPHRDPMILVDKILREGNDFVECLVRVDSRKVACLQAGEVPIWVGLEYMAQTIGVWVGLRSFRAGEPIRIGFLVGTRHLNCNGDHFVDKQELIARAQLHFDGEDMGVFECTLRDLKTHQIYLQGKLNVYQPQDLPEAKGA